MHQSTWLHSSPLLSPVLPVAVNISTQTVFLQRTLHQSEGCPASALCGSVRRGRKEGRREERREWRREGRGGEKTEREEGEEGKGREMSEKRREGRERRDKRTRDGIGDRKHEGRNSMRVNTYKPSPLSELVVGH